jgi:hypothetical protein
MMAAAGGDGLSRGAKEKQMGRARRAVTALAVAGLTAGGLTLVSAGPAQAAWQCTVPPGMTWTWATYDPDCGVPNGISYNVVAPQEGMWACMAPVGWDVAETRSSSLCAVNPGFPSTEYRLTRAG